MCAKFKKLECALDSRLTTLCSLRELYGYLTVLLYVTGYNRGGSFDLEAASQHINEHFSTKSRENLRRMGLRIIHSITTFTEEPLPYCEDLPIIDHAMNLLNQCEDTDIWCTDHLLTPGSNGDTK